MAQNPKGAKSRPAALVTGAGAGIGLALVQELEARGWYVYAGVRNLKRGRVLPGKGAHREVAQLDVNAKGDVDRFVRHLRRSGRPLQLLVNNAGYGLYGAFEELGEKAFRQQFETNFFGALHLTRMLLPDLRRAREQSGDAKILNVSSILGRFALPTGTAYCSSKWAIEGFSEALRFELSAAGIQVSLIEPGLIRTNFKNNMQAPATVNDAGSPYAPLNRLIQQRDYRGFSSSAQSAARRIAAVAAKKRLAMRYRVGLDARLLNVVRALLPDAMIDWIFRLAVAHTMRQRA